MHRRSTFALAFVAPLLAACAGAPSLAPATPSASTTATVVPATPTAAASPSVASVPSPAATSSEPATPLPNGTIPQGEYTGKLGGIVSTVTIDGSGWTGRPFPPDGWIVGAPAGLRGEVTVAVFGGNVFSDPCSESKTKVIDASPGSFIDFIAANKHLHAATPVKTKLAGADAIQIDVTADVTPQCASGPQIWLWIFPAKGDYHLVQGEAARFIAADIEGQTVVVAIETLDGTVQPKFLARVQPILESLTLK